MENVSNRNEQEQTQSFTNEFFRKADFLFQRRRSAKVDGELTISLNDTEIRFVASAFTDNFIDAPDTIEITLINDSHPASDRAVLVITQNEDENGLYSTLYTVCTSNGNVGAYADKNLRRTPTVFRPSEDAMYKGEQIFEDAPLDESERSALMVMISKL